jgi:hypothetical protein
MERNANESERVETRCYHVQMSWADRRLLLRSAGYYRMAAVAGAVVGCIAFYGLIQTVSELYRTGELGGFLTLSPGVRSLLSVVRGFLGLVLFWQYWKFAGATAATAGGTTGSMHEWSQLQWNMARLLAATLLLGVVGLGWDWIVLEILDAWAPPVEM